MQSGDKPETGRGLAERRGIRQGARRWAGLCLLGATISTAAVTVPTPPSFAQAQTYTFNQINITGNQRIENSTIRTYLGFTTGEAVTAGQINDALQQMQQSGVFETVTLTPRGSTLDIEVKEFPTINRISFEGNRRIGDDDLAGVVESAPRRTFSPARAENDAARIAEAYSQQGRIAAKVSPRLIRREDNRVDLIFEISEGTTIEVERIAIVGNKAYSERRLRQVLATKQAGLLRTFVGADTLIEDRVAVDQQLLSDFYASRGYVDFRILSTNVELSRERDAFFLVFNIQEGQQYRFGEVKTTSLIKGVSAQEYVDALRLKPGDIYSPALIEESVARQERLAIRNGLDFLRVRPEVTRNPETLTLDVNFVLEQGPRLFVERIDIEGNTTTLDRVIRQQFRVVEGDPFNPREISQSADRIRALGFFEDVSVDTRDGTAPGQRIVDVDVTEGPTGSLNLGGSYSITDGFGVNIGLTERNFLGRGQRLAFNISTAQESDAFSFGFTEPHLLGRDLSFALDFGLQSRNSSFVSYDTRREFLTPTLRFPLTDDSRLSVNYFYDAREMEERGGSASGVVVTREIAEGRRVGSGLGLDYTYNSRLTGLNPNAGFRISLGADFAGLGGDEKFVKARGTLSAQTRVFNEEVVLRGTLETGYLSWLGSDSSRSVDRFILTPTTIRGFEPGGIGPREIDGGADDPLGGNVFSVLRLDAEFPLPIPEEIGMRGALFYDVGTVFNLENVDLTGANVVGRERSFRHVLGASILWTTPIGPLRFNFSTPLVKEDFDKPQNFDLTVQATF